MQNHVCLLVFLYTLWFSRHVLSQKAPVCLWGIEWSSLSDVFNISAMNGLYTYQGMHDGKASYRKSGESCHRVYYMFHIGRLGQWKIHTLIEDRSDDWAYCASDTSNVTSCNDWKVYDMNNDWPSDPKVFTRLNSCPSWRCDQISIPSLPNACNGTFDHHLGNNIWSNALNEPLYWYFNPLYFRWECHYEFPDPDFCTEDEPLAYTVPGWTDLVYGGTVSLDFDMSGTQSHEINCMASASPTSSPSRNPSTPPSVFPTTGTPTDHPSDQPSDHPSVPPTYQPSKNHSGTFVNITVMVNGSISIDDVIQTVNQTVFTYLIAQRIPIPLETDIITRGTTITAVYVFSDDLYTADLNTNDMEDQISNELEDIYHGNAKVKVTLNRDADDKESTKNDDPITWIMIGVGVFAVCVIVIICCWFKRRQPSYVAAAEDAIGIVNVQPMATTRGDEDANTAMSSHGEAGERGSVLVESQSNAASVQNVNEMIDMNDSDGDNDDLYIAGPSTTTGGDTQGNNDVDDEQDDEEEEDEEDLDHMYDKVHKTPSEQAVKDDGEVEQMQLEGGEDNDRDTDAMYVIPEDDASSPKGKMTQK